MKLKKCSVHRCCQIFLIMDPFLGILDFNFIGFIGNDRCAFPVNLPTLIPVSVNPGPISQTCLSIVRMIDSSPRFVLPRKESRCFFLISNRDDG